MTLKNLAKASYEMSLHDAVRATPWNHSEARKVSKLVVSDFYEIKTWSLNFTDLDHFKTEYNDCFCLVHVRNGNLSKAAYQMHTGHLAIEKPDFEYRLLPSVGECTIVNFSNEFYQQLIGEVRVSGIFKNSTSRIVNASPEAEYLLHAILNSLKTQGQLKTDDLVLDFLSQALNTTAHRSSTSPSIHHRSVVELAKEYLLKDFTKNVSLSELSLHCGMSLFHLSRVFKTCTSFSPHQYLLGIRLKHGEVLLRNTSKSIAEIAYSSGFTSPEHFSTLFRRKYGCTPTAYRRS